MKKILSLLSMLMVTVMAFATDYTDQLTFKLTLGSSYDKALPEGTLTVEKRVDGTYNVTACGCDFSTYGMGNWGDLSCDAVEGTTDADGLTTIQVSNPEVFASGTIVDGFSLKGESLLVKFNETKAYALFKGKLALNAVAGYPFEYTFGTDEGFESTGGGSTGGGETGGETKEEYPINFDKSASNTHESRYSTSISLQQDGKDKQTITFGKTMKGYEDLTAQKFTVDAGAEVTPSIGYVGEWMHGYVYIDLDNNKQFSFNADGTDQTGTEVVSYSYYKDKNSKGEAVASSCNVNPMPAFTAPTTPGTYRIRFKVDWDNIDAGGSVLTTNHILSNGGGIWDATLEVVAAEPEVKEEKSFTDAISMVAGDMSETVGQAQVTIKEMTDETISMTLAIVGQEDAEYTASGFTKTVDTEKNRTTYTGSLNVDGDDFDVTALVYTEGTVEKLYMVAKGAEYNYVVGTNPDAATVVSDKTYTSNLRILDGEEPVVEETEAQVNVTKYSDDTYKITLKDVSMLNQTSDLVFVGKAIAEETDSEAPLTIMAKSDGATTNFFGEEMNATFELTEVSAEEIKMDFSIESENFSYMGEFNYEDEVEEPEVYTSNLHIYDASAPETDLFKADKANVEFLATSDGEFRLTLKDVTLNEKTQDLVFTGTLPTTEPGGQEPLAEEGEGEVTPDEPAMVLNATADEATTNFFGGGATYATAVFNVSYDKNDNFMMTFTIAAAKNYGGEFNYEVKTPAAEPFCKENYVADGNGFEWEIPVDWDTQKIVMSIDPSTCTGSCEHVIGLGAVPTAWNNTLNLYRTSADQMLQGYFQVPGGSNNNTDKFAETVPFLVEVSKAKGFVVNGEVKIASSAMSYLFTLPTVKMGTGEGVNDKSRATYNYVKVVDKDWTKDPETGINATTVAEGEFEVFSVDGVKLSKLQKGLNIVRSADGKVKKVLVK